ncbi:MAG: hypothetical protein ACT4PW_12715 [Acidimicrobiia bacterium]
MLDYFALVLWKAGQAARAALGERASGDRAEGVISTAIAVLVVAFLGAGAYLIFSNLINDAGTKASTQVSNIGGSGGGSPGLPGGSMTPGN